MTIYRVHGGTVMERADVFFSNNAEVPVHVQRGYRFCQFSKEGTDMDIHRGVELYFSCFEIYLPQNMLYSYCEIIL